MKKLILTVVIILGFSQFINAQVEVGVGLMEASNSYGSLALEGKANFGITDKIDISPSVDFFFPTTSYVYGSEDEASLLLTISVDGHYAFPINDKFEAYGLAGANFLLSNVDDNNWYWDYYDFGPKLFVNVGGGATFAFTDSMKAYLEAKYTRFGPTVSAGILFSL
jgi:opacity protein-like surface antigen